VSSDIRDLLSRMADELDHYRQLLNDDRREVHALAAEARAALAAEPVGEGPSRNVCSGCGKYRYQAIKAIANGAVACCPDCSTLTVVDRNAIRDCCGPLGSSNRAAPPAPEPGEVGELGRVFLKAADEDPDTVRIDPQWLTRAATLLQQQQHLLGLACQELGNFMEQQPSKPAPVVVVPVPVSERPWERDGWCDEQGYCWFFSPRFNTWSWERPPFALTRGVGRLLSCPFHAIPLPQAGEGEAQP
jgi:hypothetical protein